MFSRTVSISCTHTASTVAIASASANGVSWPCRLPYRNTPSAANSEHAGTDISRQSSTRRRVGRGHGVHAAIASRTAAVGHSTRTPSLICKPPIARR